MIGGYLPALLLLPPSHWMISVDRVIASSFVSLSLFFLFFFLSLSFFLLFPFRLLMVEKCRCGDDRGEYHAD